MDAPRLRFIDLFSRALLSAYAYCPFGTTQQQNPCFTFPYHFLLDSLIVDSFQSSDTLLAVVMRRDRADYGWFTAEDDGRMRTLGLFILLFITLSFFFFSSFAHRRGNQVLVDGKPR